MSDTTQDPRATATLKKVRKDGDEVIATMFMENNEENRNTVKDLGYEITDNDEIEFELNIPEHEVLGISNLGDYLVSSAQWVMGLKDEYIPKRELSKILIEFFQEIKDERE